VWNRASMANHNHLLGKMAGLDGIKTGYTVDSGFTLAASAQRGNRRLIAVVLGEPSVVQRNRDASDLLEAGFSVLDRRGLGQAVTVASVLPTLNHTALRMEGAVEQGDSDEAERPARVVPVRRAAHGRAAHTTHATHAKSSGKHGAGKHATTKKASGKASAKHGTSKTATKSAAKKTSTKSTKKTSSSSKPTHHHKR
jgi:D-alanyl-D-alanine carboxypeptidase